MTFPSTSANHGVAEVLNPTFPRTATRSLKYSLGRSMAVVIYLADSTNVDVPSPVLSSVCLESGAEYWFLYRYFEGANLDRSSELIDLYGGAVIDGYQLHRLQTELEQAERDVTMKPDAWPILIGWSGVPASKETEDWRLASKATMLALIGSLLALVRHSSASGLKLVSSGD